MLILVEEIPTVLVAPDCVDNLPGWSPMRQSRFGDGAQWQTGQSDPAEIEKFGEGYLSSYRFSGHNDR